MTEDIEPFVIHVDDGVLDDLRDRLDRDALSRRDRRTPGGSTGYRSDTCASWSSTGATGTTGGPRKRGSTSSPSSGRASTGSRSTSCTLRCTQRRRVPAAADRTAGPGRSSSSSTSSRSCTDEFHVVVPSLPGYGFSDPPHRAGVGPVAHRAGVRGADGPARLHALRRAGRRLGGAGRDADRRDRRRALRRASTSTCRSRARPDDAAAAHRRTNRPTSRRSHGFRREEAGYSHEQGTKPQTLGVALNDSPAGLLAWIVEKFRTWSDCDGDPGERVHARPAAHQRDAVLGDGHDHVVGAAVLGGPATAAQANDRGSSRSRPAWRASRRRSCATRVVGGARATT